MIRSLGFSIQQKSDFIGVSVGALCLIHCIATPFLFVAQTYSISKSMESPIWWEFLDFIFLLLSFMAVYRSTKTSQRAIIGKSMWFFWICLTFGILNEKLAWLPLSEIFLYIPAIALITLHLFNHKLR